VPNSLLSSALRPVWLAQSSTGHAPAGSLLRLIVVSGRGPIVLLMLWLLAILVMAPPSYMLPIPTDVLQVLVQKRGLLVEHGLITLLETVLGLIFGTIAGISVALLVAALPRTSQFVWPVLVAFQALPVFAIAPLLVLWFGFGLASKVVMASLIIFFPVASAFADGLRRTAPPMLEAAEILGAGHLDTLLRVRIPLALPNLLSGLRVAAPLAPLGAVVGEWVGSAGGLGFIMLQANARMQTDLLFAALLILTTMTLVLRFLVNRLAPILVPWARDQ
jgi:putative hydroxymethylpyrimidine transport system permease protein